MKVSADIFNAPKSQEYNDWLQKLKDDGYSRTYAIVPKLDERISYESFTPLRRFEAEDGGWYTTGDQWSVMQFNDELIYCRSYGNAIDYWAKKSTIQNWYHIWYAKQIQEYGDWQAAFDVLYYHQKDVIGSDMPDGLVEMLGLNYFLEIARRQARIFWGSTWRSPEKIWSHINASELDAMKICIQYEIPIEIVWRSPIEKNWKHYQQRKDGTWWIETRIDDKTLKTEYRQITDLPLSIQRSGGFYAPPLDTKYQVKQLQVAGIFNIPAWDLAWVDPVNLRPSHFAQNHQPESALEVVKEAITRGEADVWQVIIWHDRNNKLYDSAASTYSRLVYSDFYFSSEPEPLDTLGYNSELGLHPIKS